MNVGSTETWRDFSLEICLDRVQRKTAPMKGRSVDVGCEEICWIYQQQKKPPSGGHLSICLSPDSSCFLELLLSISPYISLSDKKKMSGRFE